MTKTQIFLQNFCHGQICCPKTLESRKKPAENKQTAKAVCYLSRYSYSTVYPVIDNPPDQKKKERLIREKPLLEAFWSWAEKSAIGELPKSKLSKAFHYALNNREGFWNYLEDGNCSISNSLAENCIRPFVIGRKNWLFSGSPKGAEASAGIYTLVETAKANGLAPMKYIKYILSDMPGSAFLEHPEYLDDYLPWNPLVKEFCR